MASNPIDPKTEEMWQANLTRGHRAFVIFKHLPSEPRCKTCHSPFGGIGGTIVGRFGFKPSRKNPNLCERCCEHLPPGGAEVDLAILFADVRGSTELGQRMSASDFKELMSRFYLVTTRALIRHDAVIDKLIGDEVMALFIPGMSGQDYQRKAAAAALDVLTAVGYGSVDDPWIEVGIGIHSGRAFVGNVGPGTMVDFTALGDAVNTAARLQGQAEPGEVILSEEIYAAVRDRYPNAGERDVELKGKAGRLKVRTLRA